MTSLCREIAHREPFGRTQWHCNTITMIAAAIIAAEADGTTIIITDFYYYRRRQYFQTQPLHLRLRPMAFLWCGASASNRSHVGKWSNYEHVCKIKCPFSLIIVLLMTPAADTKVQYLTSSRPQLLTAPLWRQKQLPVSRLLTIHSVALRREARLI